MSKPSFRQHLDADLRLCLLRVLAEAPGCRANASILQDAVNAIGHHASRDQILMHLGHLASLGAVDTEAVGPVTVAALTDTGANHLRRLGPPLPGVKLPMLG